MQGEADHGHHGWGLGLHLAKVAVDRHQGTIELVPADDGKGAALRINVPKDGPAPSDSESKKK